MKRVLIVAYPFPPAGGPGIKRTLKFIKYLPRFGWDPCVLTVKNGNHDVLDPSLLNEIPVGVTISRTFTFESILTPRKTKQICKSTIKRQAFIVYWTKRTIKRAYSAVYKFAGRYLVVPDAHVLWVPSAFLRGIRISRNSGIELIYSTGPTFTDHIVAWLLSLATSKKFVVDFRDAWIANPSYKVRTQILRKVESLIEKSIVRQADKVVSTTSGITMDFQERYPNEDPEKFVTIYNGYDLEDYTKILNVADPIHDSKFNIVHTGTLSEERSPRIFLEALRRLIDRNPHYQELIRVLFVGRSSRFLDGKLIEDYVTELHLERNVRIAGFVSRSKSIEYQQSADLLLLIIGMVPIGSLKVYGLSGKIFDYALSGKPVIALSQDGATAEFIRKNNIGVVVDAANIDQIAEVLNVLIKEFQLGSLKSKQNRERLTNYDFEKLTSELADHFDACMING